MLKMRSFKNTFSKIILLVMLLCACTRADYELASGETGSFGSWQGKWVLINYWAVWCAPCHEEIPEFNAFAKTHPDVIVFGVNFDNSQGDALKKDIAQMNVEFSVLITDPAAALRFKPPAVLPTTIVLNPQGKVQTVLLGPQTQTTLAAAIGAK